MKTDSPRSAINILISTIDQQEYRPELLRFVQYQKKHYRWIETLV